MVLLGLEIFIFSQLHFTPRSDFLAFLEHVNTFSMGLDDKRLLTRFSPQFYLLFPLMLHSINNTSWYLY